MAKTYSEINEKIRNKQAVVVNAEEIIALVDEIGLKKAAEEVDIVTTATFGAMCSSGAVLNTGHSNPRIKMQKAWLNNVPAYCGLAAVDIYLGATELPENDPGNYPYPGDFSYGGGHVIQDLIEGKDIRLRATSYGTDCYPRKELDTWINIKDLNEAYLLNPRNAYQNYNVAVNLSGRKVHTYMGTLKKNLGNANYATTGQLSPLFNDPLYKTIGIGTRVWLGGAQGYVYWQGTQHNPSVQRNEKGIPLGGAATLGLVGDLKKMSPDYIIGTSIRGYGVSLSVGLGVPIPILNEDILRHTTVKDEDITAPIIDYSDAYPNIRPDTLGKVSYAELKTGEITVKGQKVPTSSLSSYSKSLEIAEKLKKEIKQGKFLLSQPVQPLPPDDSFRLLKERKVEK